MLRRDKPSTPLANTQTSTITDLAIGPMVTSAACRSQSAVCPRDASACYAALLWKNKPNNLRALLLRCLQCALALRAEFRLIVFQALLCLLPRLTLAQLLDIGFTGLFRRARASLLAATLARGLRLNVSACRKRCNED